MTQQYDDIEAHFVISSPLLKARAAQEGSGRFIYVEASNEERDQQGEIVLADALKESADTFLKFGVVDIDHKSMPTVAAQYGIKHPDEWIIGQPVDVRFDKDATVVKAQLREGDTPLAERANKVWDGLTKLIPPDRYYASVGGSVLAREVRVDPETHERVPVITKTRWVNLALSLQPVNQALRPASTVPVGTFAKSLNGYVIAKTLTAGYGTNSADLVGGGALRIQSLHGSPITSFETFRNNLATALKRRDGSLSATSHPLKERLIDWGTSQGIDPETATSWVHRFLFEAARHLRGMTR